MATISPCYLEYVRRRRKTLALVPRSYPSFRERSGLLNSAACEKCKSGLGHENHAISLGRLFIVICFSHIAITYEPVIFCPRIRTTMENSEANRDRERPGRVGIYPHLFRVMPWSGVAVVTRSILRHWPKFQSGERSWQAPRGREASGVGRTSVAYLLSYLHASGVLHTVFGAHRENLENQVLCRVMYAGHIASPLRIEVCFR